MSRQSPIFEPIEINGLQLKNRIIFPAMATDFACANGEVSDRLIAWHVARAAGGCGLNMLEATYMDAAGNTFARGVGAHADAMVPGLRRLTDAVHEAGGKIGIQLQHGGRSAIGAITGLPIPLVSPLPGITPLSGTRTMTLEDAQNIVAGYAQAARRAVKAGFDLVEIHCAHGYLLMQFLSPFTNKRTDAYGGSLANRLRLPVEVIKAVREALGPNFPISLRLSVEEFLPDGFHLDEAKEAAKAFVAAGVDMLSVSVGVRETKEYTIPPSSVAEGWNKDRSAAIRKAIARRVPVAVAGRILRRSVAEEILQHGNADLVVMGRALIADPELPNKLLSGKDTEICPCVSCNDGCVGHQGYDGVVGCAVNPYAGAEGRWLTTQAMTSPLANSSPRKIVVVGGGPAGMQAAMTGAQRGDEIILLEKSGKLGGLLNYAALPPHKGRYGELTAWYARMLEKLGVAVRLNTTADVALLKTLKPDLVIIATGSHPIVPGFCKNAPVLTAEEALAGADIGRNALILGGGLVACETAEYLLEKGCAVTILEMAPELAGNMEARTRTLLLPRLYELGLKAHLSTKITDISPEGIVSAQGPFGERRVFREFDSIINALGYRPDTSLQTACSEAGIKFRQAGDCAKVGKVLAAVRQGMEAVNN